MHYSIANIIFTSLLLALPGCQTQQTDPPIAGQWSEPVNGVRMMAVPIADSPYVKGSRTVLIFTQNVGDVGINLPTINPTPFVTVRPNDEALQEQPQLSGNLRIQIEPTDNEGIHGSGFGHDSSQQMQSLSPDLMPGEIRVFALILKTDKKQLMAMQKLRDREVESAMTQWLIHSPEPRRYRVYLSFRPDGFGPPAVKANSMRKIVDFTWAGQQIDLPPFEMTVSSTDGSSQ
jgi:hypothetical protein